LKLRVDTYEQYLILNQLETIERNPNRQNCHERSH